MSASKRHPRRAPGAPAGRSPSRSGPADRAAGPVGRPAARCPQRHRVPRRLEALPDGRHRPRGRDVQRPPRRVRLPRRLDRLGQVDDHAAAASRSSSRPAGTIRVAGRDLERDRRARRSRTTAATSASSSRTSSCCPTARCTTTSPTRCRSPARTRKEIRAKVPGHPAPDRPVAPSCTTTPTSSPAASSSASPWRARSSTTRRCCWPTSRPATSTPRRRSGSCSCSTASTAPARPSSSPRTTAHMVDRMRRRVIELQGGPHRPRRGERPATPARAEHRRVRRAAREPAPAPTTLDDRDWSQAMTL